MKATILNCIPFLLLYFLFSVQLNAQIGIKVGANLTTTKFTGNKEFRETLNEDHGWLAGAQFGVFYERDLSSKFTGTVEILFNQKGFDPKGSLANPSDLFLRLDYLSIPFMAHFYPTEKLGLGFGVDLSYLLEARLVNAESPLPSDLYDEDIDVGLNLGAKFQLLDRIWIEGRFNYGLLPVMELSFTDVNGEPQDTLNMKNRSFHLGLAVDIL